jgi:penicillin-binding protein 2
VPSFQQQLRGRYAALGIAVLCVLGLLLGKLWTMQILNGAAYAQQAEQNRIREVTSQAPRGRILDRSGRELVSNRASMAVLVAPSAKNDTETLSKLSTVLGTPLADIRSRVASVKEEALAPRVVALDVPMSQISYIAEHASDFPGVEVGARPVREYPQGALAAHVVGYTGEVSQSQLTASPDTYQYGDMVGKSGAELQFETVLQGDRGQRLIEVDAAGRPRKIIQETDPVPGHDVVLTIDSKTQAVAEHALAQALVDAHKAKFPKAAAGAAVALDVRTGEVLAMASTPTYDPQLFLGGISKRNWESLTTTASQYPLTNRAIMGLYPAASTFKAMTGLAGLQNHMISSGTTNDCKGSWIEMGKQWKKFCWNKAGHGVEDFYAAIRDSCDSYFYHVGYLFYRDKGEKLQKFARKFGFGAKSGIDLPGEASGRVPDAAWKAEYNANYPEYRQWLPGDTVNLAIGQGDLLVTPLQMANAYAGIANGGKVMTPHVLREVLAPDGSAPLTYEPKVAFDSGTSSGNLSAMRSALTLVTSDGTAKEAFAGFPVKVAGKTGTAQVAGKDDYAWFVGFAPAEKPRYVVAVLVEQGGHGGSVAAPAAREILASLLGQKVVHVSATDTSR